MKIKNSQIEKIENEKRNDFIRLSIQFINENFSTWAKDKSEDDLKRFINRIIEFTDSHKIYYGINIQKIIHYSLEYDFEIPLKPSLSEILSDKAKNETTRVENFYLAVASGRYKLKEILQK